MDARTRAEAQAHAHEFLALGELCGKAHISNECIMRRYAMGRDFQMCFPSIDAWNERKGYNVSINPLTQGHKEGLLEFWDGVNDPIGSLTAQRAFELITAEQKKRGW